MRSLLIVTVGFLAGAGAVAAVVVATSQATKVTVVQAAPTTPLAAGQVMSGGMTGSGTATSAMRGGMMNASAAGPSTMRRSGKLVRLTIQHVQRGCHVWSNGQMDASTMRLHMTPGEKLQIMDMDVDAHQMMELGGPMHMQMGGPMMMNHGMTLSFTKKGVYRLATRTVEMPGGGMDVKTIGPDNKLRLIVSVT